MESQLHSDLGKVSIGCYALNKSQHYFWGICNAWITDQFVVKFLFPYDGSNGPICRPQIQIMMLHMDIIHNNALWIVDASYMSCHGDNMMWFDPLLADYDAFAATLQDNVPLQ